MNFLLRTVFSKHVFTGVNDVYQAMDELKKKRVDAIIIDMDYHQDENLDFIQHVQSSSLYNVPIVVLSSDRSGMIYGNDTPEFSVFFKPFSPIDMLSKVESLISNRTYEKVI